MEKEESPTDATVELDGDDMEGSGEDGDLEGSDSEAAQWADQEQWFGMQWLRSTDRRSVSITRQPTGSLQPWGLSDGTRRRLYCMFNLRDLRGYCQPKDDNTAKTLNTTINACAPGWTDAQLCSTATGSRQNFY